jgi:signal recognition particle subunit SRP54
VQALILSMTPAERANPKLIDGSRRARIARGSGRSPSDVNQLIDRFLEARKMMLSMARGGGMSGLAGMPGMPGAGGRRGKARQQAPQKRAKRGSGNPAKRAAEQRLSTSSGRSADGAAAFGFGADGGKDAADVPTGFELPKELKDLL